MQDNFAKVDLSYLKKVRTRKQWDSQENINATAEVIYVQRNFFENGYLYLDAPSRK